MMTGSLRRQGGLLLCCLLGHLPPAAAATWFVATNGNDTTGTGAPGAPFRTVSHALQQAGTGDVVEVRGGTYREAGEVRFRQPGVTLRSYAGEWAVIAAPLDNEDDFSSGVQIDPDADRTTLARLEISGGYYYGIMLQTKWDWGDPDDRAGACQVVIEDCVIHDTGRDGIKITPNCDDVLIQRCEIYHTGVGPANVSAQNAEGIDCVNGDRVVVRDCVLHDIYSTGLYLKGGSTDGLVERTRVSRCGGAGILLGFDTSPEYFDLAANPRYYENLRGTVRNCLVRDTGWEGIGMYAASNPTVFNNTLVNVCTGGIHAALYFGLTYQDWDPGAGRPPSVNPAILNNLISQPAGFTDEMIEIRYSADLGGMSALSGWPAMDYNGYYIAGGGVARFTDRRPGSLLEQGTLGQWQAQAGADLHSLVADPQFMEGTNGALWVASPYIDRGTNAAWMASATDLTGNPRLQGAAVDIGARESASSGGEGLLIGHAALAGATNPPAWKLAKIVQLRWFFTHASVGGNLVTGLNVLRESDPVRFPLRIYAYDGDNGNYAFHGGVATEGTEGEADYRASASPASTSNGVVYECQRGNPGWENKMTCFSNSVVASGWHAPKVQVVLDKFCWIDPAADPAAYCARMAGLESRFPQTLFLYVTMPLTTETAGSENDQRNLFNRQVRTYCRTNGKWLLDLADIEAWTEAGAEQKYVSGGVTNQRMVAAYALDAAGGDFHLNLTGRRRAALGWYALALALCSVDRDSDGVCDADELIAGTCPTNAQDAAVSLVIAPARRDHSSAAADGQTISVTADVAWTAATNVPWLAITGGASGTTNGTVVYSVASNGSASARTGLITVAGSGLVRTCTVVQAGRANPSLALNPAGTNVPATASSGRQIAVTAANVAWTAATNVPWLIITGGASGTTNGTVIFSVASNGSASARTGLITVAGSGLVRTCTVVQAGTTGFATRRINCGGPAIAGAASWLADTGYSGGTAKSTSSAIANASNAPQAVYQTRRYAPTLTYSFPTVPDGNYTIRLHFAELYYNAAGRRRFNVSIEGQLKLTNFDIYQEAGGKNRAVIRTFENVAVSGGLQIQGVASLDGAQFNGIEIELAGPAAPAMVVSSGAAAVPEGATATFGVHLNTAPASATTVTVTRASGDADISVSGGVSLIFTAANYATDQTVTLAAAEDADTTAGTATIQCTSPGYTTALVTATEQDNDVPAFSLKVNCGGPALAGGWLADTGFLNGRVWSTAATVANATGAPMALYQRERSSAPLRYSLTTVPNGTYRVRLHFNDMSSPGGAGRRLFNVYLEGALAEANLDVFALAGGSLRALVRSYSVTVTGGNGLQIELTRVAGYPQLNGIEVSSGLGAAGAAARKGATMSAVWAPDTVLTSEDQWAPGAGWAAVDGDLETVWQASGSRGSWICLGYEKAVTLQAVDVQFTRESPTGIFALASDDARDWFELEPELERGPVLANYFWFIFPVAPWAPPAAVREIQIRPVP